MCKSTYESLSSRPLGSRSAGGENELSWVSDYAIAPALRQASVWYNLLVSYMR